MAKQVKPIPEGSHSITPHLTVKGAAKYADFLKNAFGAVERLRMPGPGGRLMHVQMRIGDSNLMFADHFPEFGGQPIAEGHWPLVLHLSVPDADKTFARVRSEFLKRWNLRWPRYPRSLTKGKKCLTLEAPFSPAKKKGCATKLKRLKRNCKRTSDRFRHLQSSL